AALVDRFPGPPAQPAESAARMGLDLAGHVRSDRRSLAGAAAMGTVTRLPASVDGVLAARPRVAPQSAAVASGLPPLSGVSAAVSLRPVVAPRRRAAAARRR